MEDSAELELPLVDIPGFDHTVERGGWNAQLAAAPDGPETQPRLSASGASIISNSQQTPRGTHRVRRKGQQHRPFTRIAHRTRPRCSGKNKPAYYGCL